MATQASQGRTTRTVTRGERVCVIGEWSGPHWQGEDHPNAKLTEEQVIEIRRSPDTLRQIAASYGVSKRLVWAIKHLKAWAHV